MWGTFSVCFVDDVIDPSGALCPEDFWTTEPFAVFVGMFKGYNNPKDMKHTLQIVFFSFAWLA